MKSLLAVMAVLLPCALVAQERPTVAWELAQPDAKVLIGVNLRSLKASQLAEIFGLQLGAQLPVAAPAGSDAANPLTAAMKNYHFPGAELLTDIDRVFISSTSLNTPANKQDSSFLLVLEGTFPAAHYNALLQGEKRSYRTVPVYRLSKTPGPPNTSIALINEHMILVGDERSVFSALDRRGRALPLNGVAPNPLLARAAELAPSHDLWVIASGLRSSFPQAAANGMEAMASEVDGVEIAISAQSGLTLDANLTTKTEATAQLLASVVSAQLNAQMSQLPNPQAVELARKLQIGAKGNRLEMHIALTKEEVAQQIKLSQEARLRGPARPTIAGATAGTPTITVRSTEPVKPAGPRKVKIYGLDEGVKEINLDRP